MPAPLENDFLMGFSVVKFFTVLNIKKGGIMSVVPDDVKKQVKERLEKSLKKPIKLVYFTQELECQFCQQTHQLLEEIVSLSDKISLTVFNFAIDKEETEKYKVDKIPAIIVMNDEDSGIRFYGLPAGYEFTSLIEGIIMVSTGETGLTEKSVEKIKTLSKPVHIQVFVTNT